VSGKKCNWGDFKKKTGRAQYSRGEKGFKITIGKRQKGGGPVPKGKKKENPLGRDAVKKKTRGGK